MLQRRFFSRSAIHFFTIHPLTHNAPKGNEEDYIIISLVRSRELGFLKNLRRTNVMLTRCKYGMFICSSQAFLNGPQGAKSLVGQLLKHVGEGAWLDLKDLDKVKYVV